MSSGFLIGADGFRRLNAIIQAARGDVSYFHRVHKSLQDLPSEHREAALLVFSRVLYFPTKILDEMWRFLWYALRRHLPQQAEAAFLDQVQFFEVDPSGMTSRFAHLNRLHGRLDTDTNARASDIVGLGTLLLHLSNSNRLIRKHAVDELTLLVRKKYWAALTEPPYRGRCPPPRSVSLLR